jgi:hypothetical protein
MALDEPLEVMTVQRSGNVKLLGAFFSAPPFIPLAFPLSPIPGDNPVHNYVWKLRRHALSVAYVDLTIF